MIVTCTLKFVSQRFNPVLLLQKRGGPLATGFVYDKAGNLLLSDGVYRCIYDAEGNRTAKFKDTSPGGVLFVGDTDVTVYGFDQRNRMVAVSHVATWSASQDSALAAFSATGATLPGSDLELRSTYDFADRRIRRSIDDDGAAGAAAASVSFAAYAAGDRTLEIARNNSLLLNGSGQVIGFAGKVIERNLLGPGEDEVLAVDKVAWSGSTPTPSTFWLLGDHQRSVRDIVSGNTGSLGQVVEHRQFDSFGNLVRQTTGPQAGAPNTADVGIDFRYAGRPFEARTGLSDNRARWYEPSTGRFINEDPSRFSGGDANLFRYVGNSPLDRVDPSGLKQQWAGGATSGSTFGLQSFSQPDYLANYLNGGSSFTAVAQQSGLSSLTYPGSFSSVAMASSYGSPAALPIGTALHAPFTSYANVGASLERDAQLASMPRTQNYGPAIGPSAYDRFSFSAHSGLAALDAYPGVGVIPDAVDWLFTVAEYPFGKSTRIDIALATTGIAATLAPLVGDIPAAAAKIAARAARFGTNTVEAVADVARVAPNSAVLRSLNKLNSVERATPELLDAIRSKG